MINAMWLAFLAWAAAYVLAAIALLMLLDTLAPILQVFLTR